MLMQLIDEIAAKHGLAALIQEKPFAGINGSGKHNNWSLGTPDGVNLFNPGQLAKKSGKDDIFPIVMAAMVQALDTHADLMRMAIASPGNDFRLGACEAPPSILSTYLGEDLTNFLKDFSDGIIKPYTPKVKTMGCGVDAIPEFTVPAEDRNRTSPFPYGGNRFEFRAVGSSQNVSMVNTVLCALVADSFSSFSDAIEKGAKATDIAGKALKDHWRVIFNGNGYSADWPKEAASRGLAQIDSGVEAIARLEQDKNIKLFESQNILSPAETAARAVVMYDLYSGTVEMEAKCMIDMIDQHVIPSIRAAGLEFVPALNAARESVKAGLHTLEAAESSKAKATLARVLRLDVMVEARKACDEAEAKCPANLWTLATYKELLFLDTHQGAICK